MLPGSSDAVPEAAERTLHPTPTYSNRLGCKVWCESVDGTHGLILAADHIPARFAREGLDEEAGRAAILELDINSAGVCPEADPMALYGDNCAPFRHFWQGSVSDDCDCNAMSLMGVHV